MSLDARTTVETIGAAAGEVAAGVNPALGFAINMAVKYGSPLVFDLIALAKSGEPTLEQIEAARDKYAARTAASFYTQAPAAHDT